MKYYDKQRIQSIRTCYDSCKDAFWYAKCQSKRANIGRPQVTKDDIPASFLRHYPSLKSEKLNVSELARVCDMSRTTVYKYVSLLEK